MPLASLTEYLDKRVVKYIVISHSPAYTAQGIAAISHTPGKQLAKTVVVKLDGELTMVLLPASFQVDVGLLKNATNQRACNLRPKRNSKAGFPNAKRVPCLHLGTSTE